MADVVDKKTRSRMMSGIRGKDTKPELLVRKNLHALGYRYRLHDSRLPGKPDLVFPGYRAVILVNGCFWHGHDCHLFKWPSSREDFWREKIGQTKERDRENLAALRDEGWRVLQIWECALKGKTRRPLAQVIAEVDQWLQSGDRNTEIRGQEERNSTEEG